MRDCIKQNNFKVFRESLVGSLFCAYICRSEINYIMKKEVTRGRNLSLPIDELIYMAELFFSGTLQTELAEMYGCHLSTVSNHIKKFRKMRRENLLPDYQFNASAVPPTLHINKVVKDPVTTVKNLKPTVSSPEPTKIDIAKEFLVSNDELLAYGQSLKWSLDIADKLGHRYECFIISEKIRVHGETLEIVQKILAKLI